MPGLLKGRTGTIITCLIMVGLIAGLAVGVPMLRSQSVIIIDPENLRIDLEDKPAWLRGSDLESVHSAVRRAVSTDLYEGNLVRIDPMDQQQLSRIATEVIHTGWFTSIDQVTRTSNDAISIKASFVRPVALVQWKDQAHLIDDEGRLLPRLYQIGQTPPLPLIIGVTLNPPLVMGQVWPGADIGAGLALAELIGMQPWKSQVDGIDVGQFNRHERLMIRTGNGCLINWGRPPGREGAAEVPSSQKIRYLSFQDSRYGAIDNGCIDQLDISIDYVGTR